MNIAPALFRLAVAGWFGGSVLFTVVLTPTIFKSYTRDTAGGIVGNLFPAYFRWGLACGTVALICLAFSRGRHALASAVIIAVMLAVTAFQAFVIEPHAAELKKEIPSFETTPADDPLRVRFRKLHTVSAVANIAVIGGGVVLIVLF
jgi:hypothetical protein